MTNLEIKIKADILILFTVQACKRNFYITFLYSGDLQRQLRVKDISTCLITLMLVQKVWISFFVFPKSFGSILLCRSPLPKQRTSVRGKSHFLGEDFDRCS